MAEAGDAAVVARREACDRWLEAVWPAWEDASHQPVKQLVLELSEVGYLTLFDIVSLAALVERSLVLGLGRGPRPRTGVKRYSVSYSLEA